MGESVTLSTRTIPGIGSYGGSLVIHLIPPWPALSLIRAQCRHREDELARPLEVSSRFRPYEPDVPAVVGRDHESISPTQPSNVNPRVPGTS